jgi:hypothetical protein
MDYIDEQPAAPAKSSSKIFPAILFNIAISAVVSIAVAYAVVFAYIAPLTARVSSLEQQLAKITSVYHVGK